MTATATVEVLGSQVEPSLDDLAATAVREHSAAQDAARRTVQHLVAAGAALAKARDRFPTARDFYSWVNQEVGCSETTARFYMRASRYRDILPSAASHRQALALLAGAPPMSPSGPRGRKAELASHVKELEAHGVTHREIAELVGISESTVQNWLNPQLEHRRRLARRKAAAANRRARQVALERERQQAIKRALVKEGEAFNEVYAVITRLDGLLGQARKEAQTREKREAINEAHALRDKMMDTLVRALGVA